MSPQACEPDHVIARRLAELDWPALAGALDERGYAVTQPLLSRRECATLQALYDDPQHFRRTVHMARHGFGQGEYRYFCEPLPPLVEALRASLYTPLALIANQWARRLKLDHDFPCDFDRYRALCRRRGQREPTPLILRYEENGYNCLHQDVYGELAFALQATLLLSEPDEFTGGEFLLVETRPRMQSRAEAVALAMGECILFPNQHRPVPGKRGDYRVNVRHGVSRIRSGRRFALGIIFHDAEK